MNKNINEIVVHNFFNYLRKSGITQAQYAKEHNIDPATISNWKKGKTLMTVQQINEAADYFKITANDLYYTGIERKKLEVLADNKYEPKMAQHSVEVFNAKNLFNHKAIEIYGFILVSFILGLIISLILINKNIYFSFTLLLGVFTTFGLIVSKEKNKTYIINYLDDVYYYLENSNNDKFKLMIISHVSSIVCSTVLMVIAWLIHKSISGIELIYLIVMLVNLIVSVISIFSVKRKYKAKFSTIDGIEPYTYSMINLSVSILSLCYTIIMTFCFYNNYFYLLFISVIPVVLAVIESMCIYKSLSKYRLIYENNGVMEEMKN